MKGKPLEKNPPDKKSSDQVGTDQSNPNIRLAEYTKPQHPPLDPFFTAALKRHDRVDPCFMTGKGCVYAEVIDRDLHLRHSSGDRHDFQGFMIMPFKPHLGVVYNNCLKPYFDTHYRPQTGTIELQRGDDIPRTGAVICEGICKRIQSSDFIVADISVANDNVFYELGLAFGIDQKILLVGQYSSIFATEIENKFSQAGANVYRYHDLEPIDKYRFELSKYVWSATKLTPRNHAVEPRGVLLYDHSWPSETSDPSPDGFEAELGVGDIPLTFQAQVQSAVGIAITKTYARVTAESAPVKIIDSYHQSIQDLKTAKPIAQNDPFLTIKEAIDGCYCLIVRTGNQCHPLSYFWLGYAYARGKNVIPITTIPANKVRERVDDLAFDIRAQRHILFYERTPEKLEDHLTKAFDQMIIADYSEWSRKQFWDLMLHRREEVTVFTGALHHKDYNREMVGDWDLRATSELTSYLARHQYLVKISTPVYQYDPDLDNKIEYIKQMKKLMTGKNCVLIASPDVNPLTEILLGSIYNVPDDKLFDTLQKPQNHTRAVIAVKQAMSGGQSTRRAFYVEEPADKGTSKRGFRSNRITGNTVLEDYYSQDPADTPESFNVYGHLAIVRNPFEEEYGEETHYIIVLNGVSGPATFALTHVLTGGVTDDFVLYNDKGFEPEAKSEEILEKILEDFRNLRTSERDGSAVERLVKVKMGSKQPGTEPGSRTTIFDWRRIWQWDVENVLSR